MTCPSAVAYADATTAAQSREEPMKPITLNVIAAPAAMMTLVKTALLSGVLMAVAATSVLADPIPKSGTTPYTTHFVFHPKSTIDIPGVGKAVALEAVGPTENTAGEKMLDKMNAKCAGGKKWIDGACTLTDADGDVIFSTFDTRDLDKAQPKMDCGTHMITGGTGKYKGILSLIHISEPTRRTPISYAVFCLKK